MRDKKHRVASTVVLFISIILTYMIYLIVNPYIKGVQGDEISWLIGFSVGLMFNTSYMIFNFPHLRHKETKLNASTQVWFGILLIFATLVTLIFIGFFGVAFDNALLVMSGLVLVSVYLGIDTFDVYIENNFLKF